MSPIRESAPARRATEWRSSKWAAVIGLASQYGLYGSRLATGLLTLAGKSFEEGLRLAAEINAAAHRSAAFKEAAQQFLQMT